MDWAERGLEDEILRWLENAGASRYTRDRRLDPLATSMRDFDDVAPNLFQLRDGQALDVNDVRQRLSDLKAASLIDDTGTSLSQLGIATLAAWEHYDVATTNKNDELPRHLLTVLEATKLAIPAFTAFREYWLDLRQSFDAVELIDNWDTLYVINYLDFEREGFVPGNVYRLNDGRMPLNDIEFDLLDYAERMNLSEQAKRGAGNIQNAIGGKVPRGRHRATFAMALEIVASQGHSAGVILERFGQPNKPRDWGMFTQAQKEKVLSIIADYGVFTDPLPSGASLNELSEKLVAISAINVEHVDFSKVKVEPPRPTSKSSVGEKRQTTGRSKTDWKKKAEDDAAIGLAGEKFALAYERWRLRERPELAKDVVWVSEHDDTLGYDIRSFNLDGSSRLVEVKATLGDLTTRFFISANEIRCAEENPDSYVLLRVGNLATMPVCCEIINPFSSCLDLLPASYQATFLPA